MYLGKLFFSTLERGQSVPKIKELEESVNATKSILKNRNILIYLSLYLFMEKQLGKILGIVFGIVTIILIAITFFVNLGEVTLKGSYLGYTISVTTNTTYFGATSGGHFNSWSNATNGMTGSTLSKANTGIDMIYASIGTMILALIFAIIGLVALFGNSPKILKSMSFIAPIVSAILIIVTIVLYYEGAVAVVNAGTSASPYSSILTTTISLAIGAYLAIAAVVTEFLAAGFNILSGSKN